jgi:hypothetical protein
MKNKSLSAAGIYLGAAVNSCQSLPHSGFLANTRPHGVNT